MRKAAKKQPKKAANKAPKVVAKEVASRRLITVGPDSQLWSDVKAGVGLVPVSSAPSVDLTGAIARVRPPAGAPKEHVDKICSYLSDAGCEIVRPEPAELSADELPEKARAVAKVGTHREIVVSLIAKARTRDRRALEQLCEEVMGEEGL